MDNVIGSRIKERRKQKKLTLKQVEQFTGISNGNLSEIERGIKTPSVSSLIKITAALECSADDLIFGDNNSSFTGSKISVSERETEFIEAFRQLDPDAQDEIMDLIEVKIRRKNRLEKSSASNDSMTSKAI